MPGDSFRSEPPKQDLGKVTENMITIWALTAKRAGELAHYRRTMFLAYVAEGFTEAQALELVKQL